jgi:multiple sugar transport system permease protein
MTAATTTPPAPSVVTRRRAPVHWSRVGLHVFLAAMAVLWLLPLLWAIFIALRPISDTTQRGYVSLPNSLTLGNFFDAWTQGDLLRNYVQTLSIVIPGVIITLLVASMIAFAVTKFSWRFNLGILMLFVAGNLLPQQVIIVPLYRLYLWLPIPAPLSDNDVLYNQTVGILLIHIVFQTGFCVFVLSNYMKTLSKELTEAGLVDGASVFRIWWSIILPLCRPALAALATLEFTFIYNDFFWALILMETQNKRPITAALNTINGQYYTNYNLLAAAALLAAIPTVLVFLALQRYFVSGLSLGSTKG